jgi:hypothetical protein
MPTASHQVHDFVRDLAHGHTPSPSFADGPGVQRVRGAVERSAQTALTERA